MYLSQAAIAADPAMHDRIAQCAAQENAPGDPDAWTFEHRRDLAAQPGWSEAWESAVTGGVENPGADPAVITDQMILAACQSMLAAAP